MNRRPTGRLTRIFVVPAIAAGALGLASCSTTGVAAPTGADGSAASSAPAAGTPHGTPSTKASSSSRSSTRGRSSTATRSPALPQGWLARVRTKVAQAVGSTFKATYHASIGGTLTYAQQGPKSAFVAGATTYYSDGTTNSVCDTTTGTPVCHTRVKPLTGVLSLVSPANALTAIDTVARKGTPIVHSTQAGSGQCLAYTYGQQPVKYCVNSQGLVSYITTPYGTFRLVGITTTVSDSEVSSPAA